MKLPIQKLDIELYLQKINGLLNDDECHIFIDTNIISQLYRLNDDARTDFYNWVRTLQDRFHIPVWAIHEYSKKIYSNKGKEEYLSELSKINTIRKELEGILPFVTAYIGDPLLVGTVYQSKKSDLISDLDNVNSVLNKISTAINSSNISNHLNNVHSEIEKLNGCILSSDIFEIIETLRNYGSTRYEHEIPPGFQDNIKKSNIYGDLIIWKEILEYCTQNQIKKAILISRDSKSDIVYMPSVQNIGTRKASPNEKVKIAHESLVHEFYTKTSSNDFFIIDFKTLVKDLAKNYRNLALSFQISIADEERQIDTNNLTLEINNDDHEEKNELVIPDNNENEYLGIALTDEQYDSTTNCMDHYITELKTYNWYRQNPAINEIISLKETKFPDTIENRSSFFVLGRNILQSAEGSSGEAIRFMENFSKYINSWNSVFKKALIDGMLFEVFFDSKGKIRPKGFKATFYNDLCKNAHSVVPKYSDFINERIEKVKTERFIPKVDVVTTYNFVFEIDKNGDTQKIKCNDIDISNTFISDWGYNFSNINNLVDSLSGYYAILPKYIKVEGLGDNNVVKFIKEDYELPF